MGLVNVGSLDMPQLVSECRPLISTGERVGNGGGGSCPLSPTRAYSTMGKGAGREGRELSGDDGSGARQFEGVS